MGLDPSPEIRAIERRILDHDPSLSGRPHDGLEVIESTEPRRGDGLLAAHSAASDGGEPQLASRGAPATVLAAAIAVAETTGAKVSITDGRSAIEPEVGALLAFARPGEIVVSQEAHGVLLAADHDTRLLSPAGWVEVPDEGARAVYLHRREAIGTRSSSVRRGVLPSYRNTFLGRDTELAAIGEALAAGRAVTLVGPGGIGKSRLAVEFAAATSAQYADGVWLVDAAGVDRPESLWLKLVEVLALAVRVPGATEIADAIEGRQMLLVLDNCEQLAPSTAELIDALGNLPDTVPSIATSRTRLGYRGERVVVVEPLACSADEVRSPAVELLVARARELGIDVSGQPLLPELCAAVAGMPLAIELSVAQLGHLTVAQLLARMDDQISTLTTNATRSRHGSIRAALESSLDLLSREGRDALLASSVFRGEFDLGGVTAVCGADASSIARQLVGASLWGVSPASDRARSYRLLEPIRQFAYSRLVTSGRLDDVHRRHAEHYIAVASDPTTGLGTADDADRVLVNLAAAHEWCRSHARNDLATRIATAMLSVPSMMPTMLKSASDPQAKGRSQ
jgi:predicted ATPase